MSGFKTAAVIVVTALIVIVGAGMYKFNVLQDDVFLHPTQDSMVGSWVFEEGAGVDSGFELLEDGTALSINTATLRYRKWKLEGNTLELEVISIGNGTTSVETVKYSVQSLSFDKSTMELVDPTGNITVYTREALADRAKNERYAPDE